MSSTKRATKKSIRVLDVLGIRQGYRWNYVAMPLKHNAHSRPIFHIGEAIHVIRLASDKLFYGGHSCSRLGFPLERV